MKVLIVGSGGREHALCWKVKQSAMVSTVFVAPGNPGMTNVATPVPISELEIEALVEFAQKEEITLTIVGPEQSLAIGIVDAFQSANLLIWGPTQKAAQIESSKTFAKELMEKYDIATAAYKTFTDTLTAQQYLQTIGLPVVIKADGLASGKGVIIPTTMQEAEEVIADMLSGNTFGEAGASIIIEEFLEGEEFSLLTFVHDGKIYPMPMAQDHKRAYDGDTGPNTGGMGAYAPVFSAESPEVSQAMTEIMEPVVKALIAEGCSFTGFLYGGLIKTQKGYQVIEFNARFGDPEAEVILPLLETDIVEIIMDMLMQQTPPAIQWKKEYAVGVVLAAKGYPQSPIIDQPVPQIPDGGAGHVFYAGVKEKAGSLVINGGRILILVATATTFEQAQKKVYNEINKIIPTAIFYRKDIGNRQLKRK